MRKTTEERHELPELPDHSEFSFDISVSMGKTSPKIILDVRHHPEFVGPWTLLDGEGCLHDEVLHRDLPPYLNEREMEEVLEFVDRALEVFLKNNQELDVEIVTWR